MSNTGDKQNIGAVQVVVINMPYVLSLKSVRHISVIVDNVHSKLFKNDYANIQYCIFWRTYLSAGLK